MRLLKKEFIEDLEIESQREELARKANIIFSSIQRCIKESDEHRALLLEFEESNNLTKKLLEQHAYYFQQKRKHLILHGAMNRLCVLPLNKEEKQIFKGDLDE